MTPTEILARCSAAGIRLQPAGDGLTIDAPSGALTAELLAELRRNKAGLVALLRPATAAPAADSGNGPESIDARAVWNRALDKLAGELPPAVLAACRAADARWEPGAADAPDLDAQPDAPEPCPRCGALEPWQDGTGAQRCGRCDGDALARSMRLADGAARSRKRWPAKPTPQDAPGRGPAAPADREHLDSRRPSERAPGSFAGVRE